MVSQVEAFALYQEFCRETSCSEAATYRNHKDQACKQHLKKPRDSNPKAMGESGGRRQQRTVSAVVPQQSKGRWQEAPAPQCSLSHAGWAQLNQLQRLTAFFAFFSPPVALSRTLLRSFPVWKALLMTFEQIMLKMSLQSSLILWWRLDNTVMGTEMLKNRQTDS